MARRAWSPHHPHAGPQRAPPAAASALDDAFAAPPPRWNPLTELATVWAQPKQLEATSQAAGTETGCVLVRKARLRLACAAAGHGKYGDWRAAEHWWLVQVQVQVRVRVQGALAATFAWALRSVSARSAALPCDPRNWSGAAAVCPAAADPFAVAPAAVAASRAAPVRAAAAPWASRAIVGCAAGGAACLDVIPFRKGSQIHATRPATVGD